MSAPTLVPCGSGSDCRNLVDPEDENLVHDQAVDIVTGERVALVFCPGCGPTARLHRTTNNQEDRNG